MGRYLGEGTCILHRFGWQRAVPRDPVTIGVGAAALFGATVSTTAASIIGSAIIGTALVGAQYALGAMSKVKAEAGGVGYDGPSAINTLEARGSIRQAAAAQREIFGRMVVGGAWGFYDDATAPYQYLQLWLKRGPISAVRAVIINKQRIVFSGGTPFNTILEPIAVIGQDYVGNLLACFRQGLPDQAIDPLLHTYFPPSATTPNEIVFDGSGKNVVNLPPSFRQRNVASASFRADFGSTREIFEQRWGQVAVISPLIELDGTPVYDPRDPTQDPDDPTTWKFTYNGRDVGRTAALVQAHWQRMSYGGRQASTKIRYDEAADAANYDEEIVHDADGNPRPRHQIDGVVQLNENPRHATDAMLTANRNFIVSSRGRIGWVPSRPKDPIVTLTYRDMLEGFDFRMGTPKRETFNRIRTRFTPPEKDYVEDDGPVHDRADLRASEDGDELLDTTVRTPFTGDHRAVQWLSAQFLEEARLPKTLDIPVIRALPRFAKCKIGDVVRVQHRFYPDIDGIYQILKDGFSRNFEALSWSLKQYDKDIAARDRSQDEQPFTIAEAA